MRIRKSVFCGLARDPRWQKWLGEKAGDLLEELKAALERGSCRTNREKMEQILVALMQRGHTDELEKLFRETFPFVEETATSISKKPLAPTPPALKTPPSGIMTTPAEVVDPLGIFKMYKPHFLTFPAKLIMTENDPKTLEKKVMHFIRDKIGVDWLIIGNKAYVEYFFPQYKETVAKIRPEDRDIEQYRRKNGIPPDAHVV